MKKTSIETIAKASGGRLIQKGSRMFITGIRHDSREVGPDDMFVAVKGANQDGHRYIPQVLDKGCGALLVSDEEAARAAIGNADKADVSVILAEDTIEAMGRIAAWYLDSLHIRRAFQLRQKPEKL